MVVAVLALQGGFQAHARAVEELGHRALLVRTAEALAGAEGLILPGGESTVMLRLIDRFALASALDAFVRSGRPVLATCAGLILAAREVDGPAQPSFGWLDVKVVRNAWGRQRDSFEWQGKLFIRAPKIVEVGPAVEVLDALDGEPVLVRQGNVTAATFHPELGPERSVHRQAFSSDPAQAASVGDHHQ
jgi:5'-phosphate synthase pdxT subunit